MFFICVIFSSKAKNAFYHFSHSGYVHEHDHDDIQGNKIQNFASYSETHLVQVWLILIQQF